jgi:hypothetical protein
MNTIATGKPPGGAAEVLVIGFASAFAAYGMGLAVERLTR